LEAFLVGAPESLRYTTIRSAKARPSHRLACQHGLEGIGSKRVNGRYEPDRVLLKTKCLNREEFVVVGGPILKVADIGLAHLLLGYYTPAGKLIYAGRAGTGMPVAELERLWHRLQASRYRKMPLSVPPPRGSRFGSSLVLSRVHWVRPEMVVEVSYAEWTPDGLLRHVVYLGEREDKPASDVRRDPPPALSQIEAYRLQDPSGRRFAVSLRLARQRQRWSKHMDRRARRSDSRGFGARMLSCTSGLAKHPVARRRLPTRCVQTRKRHALVTQAVAEGIYDWDIDTNALWVSPRLIRYLG